MSDSAIAGIDHVTTVLEILEAPKLFAALTALGLVVAWRYADYGSFASGGVRLGNVSLEIIGVAGGPHNEWPPRCVTLAPLGLSGLEAALDRRGVAHGKRQPLMLGGSREPLYTTISLPVSVVPQGARVTGGTGIASWDLPLFSRRIAGWPTVATRPQASDLTTSKTRSDSTAAIPSSTAPERAQSS